MQVPNRTDPSGSKSLFARLKFEDYNRPFKPSVFFMRNEVTDYSPLTSTGDKLPVCTSSLTTDCSLAPRGEPLVKQTMVGTDMRYELDRFQFLGELYWLQNDAQTGVGDGRTHDALAWFAQFGFNLSDHLKATYRYESLDFDDEPVEQGGDPYFMSPRLIDRDQIGIDARNVLSLRYDFSESNAIMLEWSRTNPKYADDVTSTILTWAFVMY